MTETTTAEAPAGLTGREIRDLAEEAWDRQHELRALKHARLRMIREAQAAAARQADRLGAQNTLGPRDEWEAAQREVIRLRDRASDVEHGAGLRGRAVDLAIAGLEDPEVMARLEEYAARPGPDQPIPYDEQIRAAKQQIAAGEVPYPDAFQAAQARAWAEKARGRLPRLEAARAAIGKAAAARLIAMARGGDGEAQALASALYGAGLGELAGPIFALQGERGGLAGLLHDLRTYPDPEPEEAGHARHADHR
jgi:hypothetical protein